jgi:hypothetical protein
MAEPDKPDATISRANFVDGLLRSPFSGESAEAPPSFGKLLDWLPGFVIGIGIAGWVSD